MEQQNQRNFPLGNVLMTRGVANNLNPLVMFQGLERHRQCDWGNVCEADRKSNDLALRGGSRIISKYKDEQGKPFWILTEADRSATTVLYPHEY